MNKKIASKRLQLSKETLRTLTADDLSNVAGGSANGVFHGNNSVVARQSDDGFQCPGGSAVVSGLGTHSYPNMGCHGGLLSPVAGNPAINGGGG